MTPQDLAAFKAAHRLTVSQLAALLPGRAGGCPQCGYGGGGVSQATITGWLAGRTRIPAWVPIALIEAVERLGKLRETGRQGPNE